MAKTLQFLINVSISACVHDVLHVCVHNEFIRTTTLLSDLLIARFTRMVLGEKHAVPIFRDTWDDGEILCASITYYDLMTEYVHLKPCISPGSFTTDTFETRF